MGNYLMGIDGPAYFRTLTRMTTYRKNPEMVDRTIRGERVLVPIMSSLDAMDSIYNLNETAAFVFEEACSGKDADDIIHALSEAFDVSGDEAGQDVENVLNELVGIGALIRVDA